MRWQACKRESWEATTGKELWLSNLPASQPFSFPAFSPILTFHLFVKAP
jgi:hypothetical protein